MTPEQQAAALAANDPASVSANELEDAVLLSAENANSDPNDPDQIILDGGVSIRYQDAAISTDSASFVQSTKTAVIDGALTFETDQLKVSSDAATLNLDDDVFELGESGFEVNNGALNSRGQAQKIKQQQEGVLELEDSTYTSSPQGDNSWLIKAQTIKLDNDEGVGTARNISLRFKGVPIFYAPAFSFPISNKRKTGLLPPRFDQSDETGFEYRQPFYWNIRPDTDATLVTRTMTDRGTQLQTELRHLNSIGLWTLNHEFISNDKKFEEGNTRYFTRLQHLGGLGNNWTTAIDINGVSDRDYFDDLGDTLKVASITHLERRADLTYTEENYTFRTRLLSYQTVDETIVAEDRPYKQLPEITFSARQPLPLKGFDATLDAELVYFDRENSITGSRFDVTPRLEWNTRRDAWYSTIAGSVDHTHYDLNEAAAQSRTVPIFSTEAGMYFDRLNETDGSLLTLEPQAFYLHAKRTDQQDLPVFDSGALDFNFSQLFRENRFSGADRINDANQLSFALSSRLITREGREKFQASVGQILYFQDRTVTLPGVAPETSSSSDIVGELNLEFNQNWSGESAIQWNPNTTTTKRSSASVQYRNGRYRLFNIGHRYLEDEGEFLNASFAWPLKENWRLAAGWNYSLDDNSPIESVIGLEYDSCCWAFRTAARRYITDDGEEQNNSILFQFVLKGLAPIGQDVTEVLSEAVGGYTYEDE